MLHLNKKKYISLFLMIIIIFSLSSCINAQDEKKGFKIYYNKDTIKEISAIKEIVTEYEKIENRKIEIIGLDSEEKIKTFIGEDKEESVVLLDGYSFLEFVNEDCLRDIGYFYKERNTREKFSIITNLYGREEGRYFGIGIMPFALELILNKNLIDKLGIKVEENNFSDVIMMLREKNIKINSYIKSEYSKELLISALVANDTIIYNMDEKDITGSIENKIYSIKDGQKMFDKINYFYNKGSLREENFIDCSDKIIDEFNKGKVTALLTTTLAADKFKSNIETIVINKLPIENKYVNAPVGIDIIVTSSIGNSNREEIDKFFRYLLQEKGIEKLNEKNIITGNKFGDSGLSGVQGKLVSSIEAADKINKLYFNIISNKDIEKINIEVENIMNGKYDGNEWNRIMKKSNAT